MGPDPADLARGLLAHQALCAVAMAHDPAPHASLAVQLYDRSSHKVYLLTHRDTRKFWLMRAAGRATLFLDNRAEAPIGSAESLTAAIVASVRVLEEAEAANWKAALVVKAPALKVLADDARCAVIELAPMHCRLTRGLNEVHDFGFER